MLCQPYNLQSTQLPLAARAVASKELYLFAQKARGGTQVATCQG